MADEGKLTGVGKRCNLLRICEVLSKLKPWSQDCREDDVEQSYVHVFGQLLSSQVRRNSVVQELRVKSIAARMCEKIYWVFVVEMSTKCLRWKLTATAVKRHRGTERERGGAGERRTEGERWQQVRWGSDACSSAVDDIHTHTRLTTSLHSAASIHVQSLIILHR